MVILGVRSCFGSWGTSPKKTSPFGPLRFSITKRVTMMNIAVNFCDYVDPVGIFADTFGRNLLSLQGICDCIACIVPCGNLFCLGEESC